MARLTGIGYQDFEKLRIQNSFYVDKSKFIMEWWEQADEVTLITRPRRFGKTLTISMTEKFFSNRYAERDDLFRDLNIWKSENFRKLQGTYPVISLSFANVKENTYEKVRYRICQILMDIYLQNRFLLEGDYLAPQEKMYFNRISETMNEEDATMSLHYLSSFLSRYYKKKVIILLDEYDTPMQEAYTNGFWEQLISFTRSLFNSTFKTNPYLERALMTGITRISRESIFSDLNNLEAVTTTSEKYADCFGFTEEEVFAALDEFGLSDRKNEVKNWYDGFTFGKQTDIYNPWSILNYLDKKQLSAYWANSSSNSLVGKLIQKGDKHLKTTFESMLSGKSIKAEFDEQIVYNQLDHDESAVWSLLLASGYLKVISYRAYMSDFGEWKQEYELELTNFEVKTMFRNMVRKWFAGAGANYNDFIKALLLGDVKAMNTYMNRVAMATFSYFRHSVSLELPVDVSETDTGKNASETEPERLHSVKATTMGLEIPNPCVCFYHGFVLGLMVELADRYVMTSNRESGFGRYDVMLEPRRPEDYGIILEFKVLDSDSEKNLADTVEEALKQIERRRYEVMLIERGVPKEKIRKYGFAFSGKAVLIGGR